MAALVQVLMHLVVQAHDSWQHSQLSELIVDLSQLGTGFSTT